MTKWRIGFETGGKKLGSTKKRSRRWQLVPFPGPHGRESAGIVDLVAIRRDNKTKNRITKRGDFFDLILLQVKGGAKRPKAKDIKRMQAVADRYHARAVYWLNGRRDRSQYFIS